MLIDDIVIKVSGGKGGKGCVAFNNIPMHLGPTGGSGGKGGNVYLEGVSNISALNQFQFKKDIKAEDGADGRSQFRDGRTGEDLILKVPTGTVIQNLATKETKEITRVGEKLLIAKGGNGGKGNFLFRSSRNTTPKQFQPGLQGENLSLRLELKLIADVGLIGLPNAGKSSLLNALTSSKSKVANYPFTTLEPNLGAYYELILADIPGLIEGASAGKGLGVKFLRHIERTKVLFHLVSAESEHPKKEYLTVKKEMEKHNPRLLKKPEYVLLTKSDSVSSAELKQKETELKKISKKVLGISILDDKSIEKVKKLLNTIQDKKTKP